MATVQSGFTITMKNFLLEYLSDNSDLIIRLETQGSIVERQPVSFGEPQNGKIEKINQDIVFENIEAGTTIKAALLYDEEAFGGIEEQFIRWDFDDISMTNGGEFIISDFSVEFE